MKKILFTAVGIILFSASCTKENESKIVTTQTIQNVPTIIEFNKFADAVDNINIKSKTPLEDQLTSYFDKKYSKNYKAELIEYKKKLISTNKNTLTAKSNILSDAVVDLDQQLNGVGFTDLQRQFVVKVTALYPLEDSSTVALSNDEIVNQIKNGLIVIRNEVTPRCCVK